MIASPDMSMFTSRFHFRGQLIFDSAHRIGSERSLAVDAPDTPIMRTANGEPFIPGSSIKGAWRSYTEAVLRTLQEQQGHHDFASDPLLQDSSEDAGLTDQRIKETKKQFSDGNGAQIELDAALRTMSPWTERLFGNGALASKVLIKDAVIDEASWTRSEVRDGVGIDRDSGRAADGIKYQFEVVPIGAIFPLEIVVENASPEELGLFAVGLKAFERGDILLGGAKSRGLGWCHLDVGDWNACRYIEAEQLLDYLLGDDNGVGLVDDALVAQWLEAFHVAVLQYTQDEEE